MRGTSIMNGKKKKKKVGWGEKKSFSRYHQPRMRRKCTKSALTFERQSSQGGRGGGLSCQSYRSAPKPQRLNKVELPETGRRSVTISPELALPSSFSSGEAQAPLKHTEESFRHLQPLDAGRRGEMPRARSRSRARLSVAPGSQELGGLPGIPATGRGGYLARGYRRPGAGSRRRSPCAPPAARSQGAASRAGEAAAARRPLPPTFFTLASRSMFACQRSSSSRPGSHGQDRLASGFTAGTGGGPAGTPAPLPEPLAGAVKLPPPSPPQPACGGDPGTKRPRQPMAAGQRRPAANHRAPHAPSRPELVAGKVRGGVAFR